MRRSIAKSKVINQLKFAFGCQLFLVAPLCFALVDANRPWLVCAGMVTKCTWGRWMLLVFVWILFGYLLLLCVCVATFDGHYRVLRILEESLNDLDEFFVQEILRGLGCRAHTELYLCKYCIEFLQSEKDPKFSKIIFAMALSSQSRGI
jgi:hypothetical protein